VQAEGGSDFEEEDECLSDDEFDCDTSEEHYDYYKGTRSSPFYMHFQNIVSKVESGFKVCQFTDKCKRSVLDYFMSYCMPLAPLFTGISVDPMKSVDVTLPIYFTNSTAEG